MYTKGETNNSEYTLCKGTKLRVRLPFSETTRCRSPGPKAHAQRPPRWCTLFHANGDRSRLESRCSNSRSRSRKVGPLSGMGYHRGDKNPSQTCSRLTGTEGSNPSLSSGECIANRFLPRGGASSSCPISGSPPSHRCRLRRRLVARASPIAYRRSSVKRGRAKKITWNRPSVRARLGRPATLPHRGPPLPRTRAPRSARKLAHRQA